MLGLDAARCWPAPLGLLTRPGEAAWLLLGGRPRRLGHDARSLRHVRVALRPVGRAASATRLGDAQPLAVPRAHRLAARAAAAGAALRPAARPGLAA